MSKTPERFYDIINPMQITETDTKHLAELTSIDLDEQEIQALSADLDRVVRYFSELSELDTSNVEATYQVTGLHNVWREDEVKNHLSREELLALAPAERDHQIEVPQVL